MALKTRLTWYHVDCQNREEKKEENLLDAVHIMSHSRFRRI